MCLIDVSTTEDSKAEDEEQGLLGLARFALCPWTMWEMSSSPRVRSFVWSDMTLLAPSLVKVFS